jgi:Domain of Unknown Function (DUF1259)
MKSIRRLLILTSVLVLPLAVSAQGLDASKIDQALGRSGQKLGDVYRVGFPRTDLHVSVNGVAVKPGLALGSWAAFSGSDETAMVMGDLVLLESELNPVMEKLRSSGFEISAIHNHLIEETPRMTLTPAQGVAESINFQEGADGVVATTGDFVLTAEEVNPVISALEQHHILVTALHSHMLTEEPRLFFMHFGVSAQRKR